MRTGAPLKTVTGAVRHFWWLAAVLTLIGLAAALVATMVRPPTYQGAAMLNLDTSQNASQGFDAAIQADQFLSQRYIQMSTSAPVLDPICAASKPRCDSASLAKQVSTSQSKGTGAIQISVTARSGDVAASFANAIADQVVQVNNQQIDARIKPQRDALQSNLNQQGTRIQQIRDQLSAAQKSSTSETAVANAIAPLLAELNQAQTQYT